MSNSVHYHFDAAKQWLSRYGGVAEFSVPLAKAVRAQTVLREETERAGCFAFADDDIDASVERFMSLAAQLKATYSRFVILGMGGATLNPQSLHTLASGHRQRMLFLDHVDAEAAAALRADLDPEDTCFIVISKSGATLETLAQYCYFRTFLQENDIAEPDSHFVFITEDKDSPLTRAAKENGVRTLAHPSHVSGRFAAFTAVGLLPAALAGVNIRAFVQGGKNALHDGLYHPEGPAVTSAAMFRCLLRCDIRTSVMMNYIADARPVSRWYSQIWAESLGKNGFSIAPSAAVGTLDQHSQLQLYLGGKKDKFFTMIHAGESGGDDRLLLPKSISDTMPWLDGRCLSDINAASFDATCRTLIRHQCPVRIITLKNYSAKALGEFMMHSMLETVLLAGMIGINPFDQPHVEEGKELTRDILRTRAVTVA